MPSWLHDPLLVVASLLFVVLLLLASARIESSGQLAGRPLRAFMHVAVGLWTLAATVLFRHQGWAMVPPMIFLAVNASSRAPEWFPRIASSRSERTGLWTFPLGILLLYATCWSADHREAMLAGIAALALADPAAAWVGRRYGQRTLRLSRGRTLEGSLTFYFVVAISSAVLATGFDAITAWRAGVLCGAIGALAEAIAPSGWDNAVIPIAVAMAFRAAV